MLRHNHNHRRSAWRKKLILRKLPRMPKNLRVDTFPDPVGHFGAPWRPYWILQAVWRCRRCGVAGGERVPPLPLGWYFILYLLSKPSLCWHFVLFHLPTIILSFYKQKELLLINVRSMVLIYFYQ